MGLTDGSGGEETMIIIMIMTSLLSASQNEPLGSPSLHDEELLKLAADRVRFIFMSIALKSRAHGIGQILTIPCRHSVWGIGDQDAGSAVYEHHHLRLYNKLWPRFPNI
jgi:hypothetical protein